MLARVRGESRSKGEQPPITAKVEAEIGVRATSS
jgi:hypothetical protein